jgi:signal recognition particle subunit SRP54
MREIRLALLEADVNFKVVREFVNHVKERALGAEVMGSLTPAQQVVKVVNEELVALMGSGDSRLAFSGRPPTVVLMAGLQGSGKTTTCAKLAKLLQKDGKRPVLIAADVYRPAAIEQLTTLAERIGVPVYAPGADADPVDIARDGVAFAREKGDVAIIDTAGRLHVDDELMEELVRIRKEVKPHNILLVIDAMTGQDAVNAADQFKQRVDIDGVVLTKLDGDARGGAALSVRAVTGKPIKFVSTGEKLDDFDTFHPDRMASRILGMGDVLSLVEEARKSVDVEEAQKLADKIKRGKGFDLEDFKQQISQMRKMGGLSSMIDKLPAQLAQAAQAQSADMGEKQMRRIEGIINSMTRQERTHPELMKATRKRRVAAGAGVQVQEVNRLLKQFEQMQKMMKQMQKGGMAKMMRGMKGMIPGMR